MSRSTQLFKRYVLKFAIFGQNTKFFRGDNSVMKRYFSYIIKAILNQSFNIMLRWILPINYFVRTPGGILNSNSG